MNTVEHLKYKLAIFQQLESVNKSLDSIYFILKNKELNIDLSNSGESCAQNYCQINTQLIESFECFNKSIDNNKQFKCFWPKCQFKTDHKNHLKDHRLVHLNKRQFVCDINECKKTFIQNSKLIRHKLLHNIEKERPFKCDEPGCNKSYNKKESLKLHNESVHLKIKYSCDWKDCNKTYKSKSGLIRHKFLHSGEKALQM